ncbi:MAG: PorT family protein [Chitinophagaceae bacterium]|nr:MAG: PorT family protein [Chitinophagaceae bacterium]
MKLKNLIYLLLISSIFSIQTFAQGTILDEGERIVEAESQDRLVVELTHDNWLFESDDEFINMSDDFSTLWYSRGISINFMYDIVFGNSRFSLAPGIGFQSTNVFHNAQLSIDTNGNTFFTDLPEFDDFKRKKLNISYLDVPIELRFRTRPNQRGSSFKVALGFKGGIRIDSKTKIKFEQDGDVQRVKEKNLANLNQFRYGPTFRIGYGVFNLIAYYSLNGVFEEGSGPSLTPISIGLSLNGL